MTAHTSFGVMRLKAMVGALLAALAVAGAVGASAPDSASAYKSLAGCREYVTIGHYWEDQGLQALANFYYDEYWACVWANQ